MKISKERKDAIIEWVADLGIAIIAALIISCFIKPTFVRETSMLPTLEDGDYLFISRMSKPKRGDIVIFESDIDDSNGDNKLLIKRVIGMPGDEFEIKADGDKNTVLINGKKEKDTYTNNGTNLSKAVKIDKIPDGMYFCMGDNRDVSLDSREIGLIAEDDLRGVAFVRVLPLGKFKVL